VVVLVVAADASVQAQTIASIKAILAENLPTVVAMTKCDLKSADIDRVKRDLIGYGLDSYF
jgi:translation initiation factor IF-2